MSLDNDMGLLAKVGLFQGFNSDRLRLLAFGAEHDSLASGGLLFSEGDAAEGGYVVASGQVDLMVRRGRRQIVIETVEEGGLIGEVAMIAPNRRATDAVARVDSEILYITRPMFLRLLKEYPDTAATLHNQIATSVRQLAAQLEDVHARLGRIASLADIKGLRDAAGPEGDERGDKRGNWEDGEVADDEPVIDGDADEEVGETSG